MRISSWVRGGVTAILCALLSAGIASAQVYSNGVTGGVAPGGPAGGVLTGTYPNPTISPSAVLPSGVTATTQSVVDSSTLIATDQFVQQRAQRAQSLSNLANITGGTYSFATLGSGGSVVYLASGGTISGVITIGNPGTNYAVGDVLTPQAGNFDAYLRVTSVSGGGITGAQILNGGTGYTTGGPSTVSAGMTFPYIFVLTGVLASNATFILPNGTFITGAHHGVGVNNTTGAFTTTICISSGANACTGTTFLLPQGTANSASVLLQTDGSTGVWPVVTPAGIGAAAVLSGTTGSIGGSLLAAGACAAGTATVTGATSAMVATASPSADPDSVLSTGVAIYAFVSSTNTVTVRECAIVAVTPAATTFNVRVLQ